MFRKHFQIVWFSCSYHFVAYPNLRLFNDDSKGANAAGILLLTIQLDFGVGPSEVW